MLLKGNTNDIVKQQCMELYNSSIPMVTSSFPIFSNSQVFIGNEEVQGSISTKEPIEDHSKSKVDMYLTKIQEIHERIVASMDNNEIYLSNYMERLQKYEGAYKASMAQSSETLVDQFKVLDDGFGKSLKRLKPFCEHFSKKKRSNIGSTSLDSFILPSKVKRVSMQEQLNCNARKLMILHFMTLVYKIDNFVTFLFYLKVILFDRMC